MNRAVSQQKSGRPSVGRVAAMVLGALAASASFGCSEAAETGSIVSKSLAVTALTPQLVSALQSGTDGTSGFILQEVGGEMLEESNENFAYNPASSIKILVAVRLLQQIDAGNFAPSNLSTTVTHNRGLTGSCPTGGSPITESLSKLIRDMLTQSSNTATRTLIDLVGGFAGINLTAQALGMSSTSMVVYPGCNITNAMTQADAARLYAGVQDETFLSATSRDALWALMPPETLDFTGTLAALNTIIDQEAMTAGISTPLRDLFKGDVRLHYKAGGDTWTVSGVTRSYSAISGLAEIPTCEEDSLGMSSYAWGLFVDGAQSGGNATFAANQAEPLRRAIRNNLANWATCGAVGPEVYLEAECPLTSAGAYSSVQTHQAGYSGIGHLTSGDNTYAATYNGSSDDHASYSASVQPGDYDVYFRVETNRNANDDSWYFRIDGGTWVTENNHSGTSGWQWVQGASFVTLGANVAIDIANRENGIDIDKIAIVPAGASAPSGMGDAASNCNTTCTPNTCGILGASCGSVSDGCGGTLSCGGCASGELCNGSNQCETAGGSDEPCIPSKTLTNGENNSQNFETQGAFCFRTNFNISGWGCSNFNGRTMSVNESSPSSSCGFGLPAQHDGYYYFEATGGSFAYASVYWW